MASDKSSLAERREEAIKQCDGLGKDFADRSARNKSRFKRLRYVSIALAVCTTLLAALAATKKINELDWFVPLISGLSALSTTFLSQTTTQKMWVNSRTTSMRFQSEKFLYTQSSGEYSHLNDEEEKLQLFSKRIIDIWSQAQESWGQNIPSAK